MSSLVLSARYQQFYNLEPFFIVKTSYFLGIAYKSLGITYKVSESNAAYLRWASLQSRHSGMLLAGEVVHGRTDNGPKDGV